jgi:hypothetical protein
MAEATIDRLKAAVHVHDWQTYVESVKALGWKLVSWEADGLQPLVHIVLERPEAERHDD